MAEDQTIQQDIPEQGQQTDGGQPDPLQSLYDGLHKSQLYTKSFDEFKQKYSSPQAIDDLYGKLNGLQLYTKEKGDFYTKYFPDQAAKFVQPSVQLSQPNYKLQPVTGANQFYINGKEKDQADQFLDQQKLQNQGTTAHQNLTDFLSKSNDLVEHLQGVQRMQRLQQLKSAADQGDANAMAQYQHESANIPLPGNNQQQTEATKKDILADPVKTRNLAALAATFHPDKAKDIKTNVYVSDAANRGADLSKVEQNVKGIQKGDLDYNIQTGQVEKQVNPVESFINGWKYKNKLFDDYDFIKSASDQELADKYEKRRTESHPDEPVEKPSGALGEITQMFASQPTKAMITEGVLAAIPGAEEAAPVAGASIGAYDYGRMGQATGFEQIYNETRNQGKSPLEAAQLAKVESQKAGDIDALQGAAMTGLAGKFGMKELPNFSKNFQKAAADFLETTGKEGATMAALGAGGQFAKNKLAQAAGIDRPTSEGMLDQIKSNFLMTVGIKAAIQGGKFVEPIIHGLSKADPQALDNHIEQNVKEGEITPEQGQAVKNAVTDQKAIDSLIPDDIDELSRLKIQAKIRERNILKGHLETTDEAFHPGLKEGIKELNQEILDLSKNKVKPEDVNSETTPENIENQNNTQNAIPEQSAGTLGAHSGGGESIGGAVEGQGMGSGQQGSQPAGEGNATQEGQSPNQGQEVSSPNDGNTMGISHGSLRAIADKIGLEQPERGTFLTPEEQIQRGRELLKGGADPQQVADDFHKNGNVSADNISVARAHYENLVKAVKNAYEKSGENSPEYKAAKSAADQWQKEVIKPMGTASGAAMSSLQGETDIDTGSFVGLSRAFEDETGKPMSAQQTKEAKGLSDKVAGLTKEVETLKQRLFDVLDKANKESGKPAKTIKERADQFAEQIRKGKTNRPGSFQAATPASLVWDSALEVMAKTVETGGTVLQALSDGLSQIRESDWYKGLSDENKKQAEDDFNAHFKNENDLFTRFADKKDNKFSTDDARDIWDYAKTEYLNKGKDFDQMISGVAKDLGLKPTQVRDALVTPKGAREVTIEMYAKMNHQRLAIQQAKAWVKYSKLPGWVKVLKKVPNFFFNVKTFGHGTVGAITHAGMNIFRPSHWAQYWPAAIKQFEFSFGGLSKAGLARYEQAMADLKNDPLFMEAKKAGLAVDPTERYDDYQTFAKGNSFTARLLKMGDRGFNALKLMRFEMWKKDMENLSETEKADPEMAKTVATLVNHSTGTSHIAVPEAVGVAFFAPRLEASRWARLITDPGKALYTVSNWKNASLADKAAAKIVGKKAAEVTIAYVAALAANQGILMATGSKQNVNFLDPTSSDWLKFKVGGRTVDPTGGIVSALGFMTGMAHLAIESKDELKGKKRGDEFVSKGGKYLRGKLSPFGSTVADFATQHDYGGNTLPFSSDKPLSKFSHKLTWKEYLSNQQLPIPVTEYFKDTEEQMKAKGMSEKDINTIMEGIFAAAITGGTGAHVTTDYKMKK